MPTTRQLQDGQELTLGILFLLDNAPERPDNMSWREFSDWVITEHLKRHSYYYHPKGKRELATVAKMRSRILEMFNKYTKLTMPESRKDFKDNVDFLFVNGGIFLFTEVFLKKQGYDKNTFSESRLNKHVSEEDKPASTKIDGRPEEETSEENDGSDTSKAKSHDVGGEERRESEADAAAPPSINPILPSPSSRVSAPLQTPNDSHTAPNSDTVDDHQKRKQNGTTPDEQLPPSGDKEPPVHNSVDRQTQIRGTDNSISSVDGKANATSSESHPGSQDEPVLGAKRKHTQDHEPRKRQCQCQVNNATLQDSSRASEAPQSAIPSSQKQQAPQLARLNVDEQGRNMHRLRSDIQRATDAILSSIGEIRNTLSPLQPDPSGPLRGLYARCWGPRWEEVRVRQVDEHVFTTPQVTASLLSAFLFDKVLTRGARLEGLVNNVLEMGGSLGRALLEELDIFGRGAAIAKRARIIDAQKACSTLAQDRDTLQQQLNLEADNLAKAASTIISPHLDALSRSAKLFGKSSDRSESGILSVFESGFAKVIEKTLRCRLRLLATGCEYAFMWPSPDDDFNSRNMQIDGGRAENAARQSTVLLTVFPGLEIKPMNSGEMESLPDAKAVVKVQRSDDSS